MAEFVMKKLVADAGVENQFEIESAATSTEEIGNGIYPPAKAKLREHRVPYSERKTARQMTRGDYGRFDLIIYMDSFNRRNIMRIIGEDPQSKVFSLLGFTDRPGDVSDPWYTGDFETTYRDVMAGCKAVLQLCLEEK